MALITRDDAKVHLNIPSNVTTDDAELDDFIDVASALVESHTDRVFTASTASQTFDGGTSVYVLSTSPIASVTSLAVSGSTVSTAAYDVDENAGVVRMDYCPPLDPGSVVVTYTAGSATVPVLAQHATKEVLRHLWETQRGAGRGRSPRGGDDYASSTFSLPRRVEELLESLRSVG